MISRASRSTNDSPRRAALFEAGQETTMTEGVPDYHGAVAKAFIEALGKHAGKDVIMPVIAARPLAAYWPFHTAHQAARRAGLVSPAPWIEAVAADIEDQGVKIPPAWWVGYHN
jgi:hypothetical protein